MKHSFFLQKELKDIGFNSIGKDCRISRNSMFYNPEKMDLGNNVRIDDFCVITGKVSIGSNVHVSSGVCMHGSNGISLGDCSGISANTVLYTVLDDFDGNSLIGPVFPQKYRIIKEGKIIIERFVQIGANCLVFPDVHLKIGSATGAYCLVNNSLDPWCIYTGIPASKLRTRSKELLRKYEHYKKEN